MAIKHIVQKANREKAQSILQNSGNHLISLVLITQDTFFLK